ncbi:DNRLRE domain-containing protein [Actinocorallia longicatena]|uniref:Carbohydrate-binding module family 96 domain-containing protein n=1 Tax=Actinocorallia longicatena TaxID=111803 RepID=A0ABP6Q9J6_9ACTN
MRLRLTTMTAVAALALSVTQAPAADALPSAPAKAPVAKAAAKVPAPVNRIGWAYVKSTTPNKGYVFKKTSLPIGRKGKAVYRSFLRMNLSSAMDATKITSAKLRLPVLSPNPCKKNKNFAVQVFITSGLTKSVTWKKQPKGKRWQWLKVKCSGKRLEVNVTKAAQKAVDAGRDYISFGLRADSEKDPRKFMTFSRNAQLLIKATFEEDPGGGNDPGPDPSVHVPVNVGNATAAGQGCGVGAGRPTIATPYVTFGGTTSDADGGFLGLRAEWRKGADGAVAGANSKLRFTDPNEAVGFTVTTGEVLTDGVYQWRVQGFDDVKGGAWTDWCEFEVTLPVVPPVAG